MFCLLIVQLIVAGVSAAGGCCDHSPGLRVCHSCCCIIPRTYRYDNIRQVVWLLPFQGKNNNTMASTSSATCCGREHHLVNTSIKTGIKSSDTDTFSPQLTLLTEQSDYLKNLTPWWGTDMQNFFSPHWWSSPKAFKVYISGIMLQDYWWND